MTGPSYDLEQMGSELKPGLLFIENGLFLGQTEFLEKEYRIQYADIDCTSITEKYLHTGSIDVVIIVIDLFMHCDSLPLDEIRESCEVNYIPILGLGFNIDEETRLKWIHYTTEILDSFYPTELLARIHKLVLDRKRVLQHLVVDPITGAYNESFLGIEIQRHLDEMKRSQEPFAVVCMKIDGIHEITQAYGYAIFHLLIKYFVKYIQKNTRPMDVLIRLKGQNFILILPKTSKNDALKLMNRLTKRFSEQQFLTPLGQIQSTFSAKVFEFVDVSLTLQQCLAFIQPFVKEKEIEEKNCVVDGSADLTPVLRKLKIAIIDDDRLIREMLKDQLQDLNDDDFEVEIRSFKDGEEFFEDPWHRQNFRYLVILDRIMPKMDGLEVLKKIRTEYDRNRYICMMLTSKSSEADISLAIQRGANDYMVKPFSLKELRVRINRLIRGYR